MRRVEDSAEWERTPEIENAMNDVRSAYQRATEVLRRSLVKADLESARKEVRRAQNALEVILESNDIDWEEVLPTGSILGASPSQPAVASSSSRADVQHLKDTYDQWIEMIVNFDSDDPLQHVISENCHLAQEAWEQHRPARPTRRAGRERRTAVADQGLPKHVPHEQAAPTPYTLADLDRARAEVTRWNDAFAQDRSNNPEKYRGERRAAGRQVRLIERALKRQGAIPLTAEERMSMTLDQLYPNAKSKRIVTHDGRRYQLRYIPVEHSRSGKSVVEWDHEWVLLDGTSSS